MAPEIMRVALYLVMQFRDMAKGKEKAGFIMNFTEEERRHQPALLLKKVGAKR